MVITCMLLDSFFFAKVFFSSISFAFYLSIKVILPSVIPLMKHFCSIFRHFFTLFKTAEELHISYTLFDDAFCGPRGGDRLDEKFNQYKIMDRFCTKNICFNFNERNQLIMGTFLI